MKFNVFAVGFKYSACNIAGERWGTRGTYPLRLAQRQDGIYGRSAYFNKGIRIGVEVNNSDGIRIGYQAH